MVPILGRWVFLGKSDIVPADLAAAAAVGGSLRLRSSSAVPTWYGSGNGLSCVRKMYVYDFARMKCDQVYLVLAGRVGFSEVWYIWWCHSTTESGTLKVYLC